MSSKIKTLEEIAKICAKLRADGKIIVTTNGSFDIIHYGHVFHLQKSKEQGDVLVLGLNSDISIKAYKSKDRPIIPQEHRAGVLAALEYVDFIVIYDETTPHRFIRAVKPHIHANDAKYGKDCVEADVIEEVGAKLYMVEEHVEGLSTTNIIAKIKKVYGND